VTNDDLLKALRDVARAERSLPVGEPDAPDATRIDQWTNVALEALTASPGAPQASIEQAAKVRISRKRGSRWLTWALPAVAAAAAILLWPRPQPSLPVYQSEWVSGFESSTRGDASSARSFVFRAGKPFELLLRPPMRTSARPSVAVFLSHAEGRAKLEAQSEVGPLGTVHVRGNLPQTLAGRGPWSLQVVLAPEDVSAETADAAQIVQVEILAPTP
jgi:hypothetical protein